MGYSCAMLARETLDRISEIECFKRFGEGDKAIEIGQENKDGAITGTIWLWCSIEGKLSGRRLGSFRIEANGRITRFAGLKKGDWQCVEPKTIVYVREQQEANKEGVQ
jgi:hypothetical protein